MAQENEPLTLAVDALAMTIAAAQESRDGDGWLTGMRTAYGDRFDAIAQHSANGMVSALVRSGVRANSPAALASLDAGRHATHAAIGESYRLLAGSLVVSARMLDKLAVATDRDPAELLREIAEEIQNA